MIDPAAVRPRFPALQMEQDGQPVLFFDNPAGTQVPQPTIDGYARYLRCANANVGGTFLTSRETDRLIEEARHAAADFLNGSPGEIVFGPNMTTLTFSLSRAIGRTLRPGDEIVTTRLEHDANVAPWLALEERGVTVRFIAVDPVTMTLDLDSVRRAITDRTRLLAVGLASNAFGTVNDVSRLTELAHERGALVFVDAVAFAPHGPIDVRQLGCDVLVCSAYKFFGPHLGILWSRRELLETLPAYRVRPAGEEPPGKWETGTQNHEALAALLGTFEYLASLGAGAGRRARLADAMAGVQAHERELAVRLIAGLQAVPGVRVFGITDPAAFDRRVPTVSFTVVGHEPEDLARSLGEQGIFTWAGNHYAVEPMACLGLTGTNRVGLVHYNTAGEIDRFLGTLEELTRGKRSVSSVSHWGEQP